tara:strand:- start:641 stop:865 length:225 start_codon:yes stop_codon:yes gene_type:complete
MSQISKEGYEQLKVIKNALDSMYDKLDTTVYTKAEGKVKDIEKQYVPTNLFLRVQQEFEAISGIVENAGNWQEI